MNVLPEDIANNESEWLEWLVDDELDAQQLPRFFRYLDDKPEAWKRCATALLDDRSMRKGVMQASGSVRSDEDLSAVKPQVVAKSLDSKSLSRRSWLPMVLVACLAMLIGAIGHRMTVLPQTVQPEQIVSSFDSSINDLLAKDQIDEVPAWRNSRTQVSFQEAFKPNTLVEVENSPTRAVYYIDHQVPKFLLEAMVIAGHQLTIGQEMVLIDGPNGEALEVPINKLEIEKYTVTSL